MASGQFEPIDENARRAIKAALERKRISQSELARRVGVNRSTINKIVRGSGGATVTTLEGIGRELDIPSDTLRVQLELDFEIDDNFAALAQRVLAAELGKLRADVGRIRANRVTGSVGLRFHGTAPELRAFERVFTLSVPRRVRRRWSQ